LGLELHIATYGQPHSGAGGCDLKEAAAHGESMPDRSCEPTGDPPCSSPLLKVCITQKGPMLEQFVKKVSLWEGPV